MADNDRVPEQISDALKDVGEITGVNVHKTAAKIAKNAYAAQVAAIGLTIPLVVGGPASLSQEQTRRPDENLPAQGQGSAEPMRSVMVATTSAVSFSVGGIENGSPEDESIYIFKTYLKKDHRSEPVDPPESQSIVEGFLDKAPREP